MDMQKLETLPPPPGVLGSLKAGFDIVSNRVALILLPLGLDMILWLAPRVSVGNWYSSIFTDGLDILKQSGFSATELATYTENGPIIVDFFNRLNWLGWIRTLPVGIPALMLDLPDNLPMKTPLGVQYVIQLQSFLAAMGSIAALTFIGWLIGGWYFRIVAEASLGGEGASVSGLHAIVQTILLSLTWLVILMIVFVPFSLVITLITLISPTVANIVVLVILFFSFWLIVPFFFTPHGIFVHKQNAFYSIYSSLRMTRFSLPTSGMFVLSTFILLRGLDRLWSVPKNDSWLTLVGIAGHAFITTVLLAASFIYYRDMTGWLQNVYEKFQQISKRPTSLV